MFILIDMFYVYVLQNEYGEIYIGYSADLRRRVSEHNRKNPVFTSTRGPWMLVYYEAFRNEKHARMREHVLKNYGSTLSKLKKRIRRSLGREDADV